MVPTILHRLPFRKLQSRKRPGFAPAMEHLEDRVVPAVINVNPSNYLSLVPTAKPGDTVEFAAGNYTSGLNLSGMNGTASAWITFDGSAGAVIQGTPSQNTVELDNTSYLLFENFTVDSQHYNDAIKAGGGLSNVSHDITIRDNTILNADSSQQTVGISTKCIAWDWTIDGNTINSAGTGMYLGDSSGLAPFVNGVIENNTVENTIGYGIEIKDQEPYSLVAGMPSSGTTILRYNDFLNNDIQGSLGQGARPNVMIGGFPASGPGSTDTYQIYGNLIANNVSGGDFLMQVTGRASIHDNILINDPSQGGIHIQPHADDAGTLFNPQQISVYDNTIYDVGTGIAGAASWPVVGNLIFASSSGAPAGNLSDSVANAGLYLASPSDAPVAADFVPLPGQAQGPAQNLSQFSSDAAYNVDFQGTVRPSSDTSYGAYEAASNPQQTNQPSATALTSSANPAVYGQTITLTATVTALGGSGTPTGSVQFMDGNTVLGTASLNSSGVATLNVSLTTLGGNSLTADYSGDSTFAGSNSATLSQTVTRAASQVAITSSAAPSVFGQSVTFTATVTVASPGSGTPTGQVTFSSGSTVLGTATLSNGVARFATSSLTVGSHTIKATYGGNVDFTGSSKSLTQTVKKDATKLIASPSSATVNQAVMLTARVSAVSPGSGTPTGTVTFKDMTTGQVLGTATLLNGTATLPNVTFTTTGTHKVSVSYSGDGDDLAKSLTLLVKVLA